MQADIDVLLSSRDVDGLLRALQLGGESKRRRNISARRRAAEALETLRAKETAPALAHALEYDVFSVARAAGQALARIGAAALEPLWEAASSSGGTSIPRRVERALQRMLNVPVEKWLLEKMQEDDEWSRETASRLLGGVGGNAAVKALDTARRRDFDTSVRQAAVVSLGRIGGQATIAPLVSALGDEDWDTRQLALRLLLDRSPFPLDAVLAELREGETRARGFAALALALAGIRDSRVVEPLLALLGQEDVTARERAAVALGSLGDERAVPPLLERLQDEAVTVRYGAAKALQQIRERTALITWETQEAEQVLQSSLESLLAQVDGEELQPCFDAATLLGWFREEQAVDALNRALDDHYKEQTHAYIIKALARIGSPGATRQLCRRLSEESWERRSDVVRSLWVTGSPEVAPALQGLCDEDDLVREEAFRALDWLDGGGLLSRFLRESSGKHAAVEAWRKSGQEASLDGLLVALESDEPPEHQARETREARDPAEQHEGATPAAAASGHRDRERSSWRPAFLFLAFYSLLCFLNHWFYELQTGLEWDIFRGWNAFPLLVGTLAGLVPLFFLFTMLRHGLGMLLDSESDEPEPTASVPATHVGMAGAVCASTVALAVMEWVAFEKAFRDILTEPVVFYPRWGSLDVSHVVHVALLTIVTGLLLYAGMLSVLWLFLSCKGLLGKAPRLRLLRLTAYPLLTCAALYFFATDITRNLSREAFFVDLRGGSAVEKAEAARQLGALGLLKALPLLVDASRHEDAALREAAGQALGMYAGRRFWSGPFPAEAVRALTGLLLDEEPRIRQEAARALVAYDYPMAVSLQSLVKDESSDLVPEALEPLLASLGSEQHKEECEKCAAADLLGRVDDSRAADALLAALDDGPRIAQAALQSLARRPSARMVAPVEAAIRRFRGYPYVLREAIRLLAEIDDPSVVPILFDALKHRDLDLKRIALAGLSKWKEVSDPKQLPLVIRQLRYEKLEADAAAIITRIGEPAVAPLAAASNSGNRRAILSILARIGGAPAIDALISGFSVDRDLFEALERLGEPARVRVLELLGSRDKKQRRNALGILTLMREPRAVEALVAMGRGGSTSHDLIKALHLIGAPAVEPLLALLESKSSRARRFAMRALAGLDDARLLHPFLRAATDPESSVRSLAISGLSKWRDPRVFDVLIASLDDEWEEVERQAVKAIGDVRDPRVPPYLVARLGAGSQDVVEALIKHGKAAVPALLEGLGSKVPGIRVGCVRVLGKIGGPSAVEALASALADPATRRTASERLEGLGWRPGTAKERVLSLVGRGTWKEIPRIGAEAIAPLTRLLEDTDAKVRGCAAASLGSIGEKATASRLVRTLKDPAPRVREAAARALSDLEWVPATASERADLLLAREDLPSLLELGRVGVDRLVAALDSESSRFRRLVTRALRDAAWSPADDIERLRYMIAAGEARKIAMLGEAALRPLTSLLRSGRPAHVRVAAAKHLAALGGPRAVRALVQALDGPIEVALEAAKALGSSKNPVAVAATVKLLTRADPRLGGLARRSLPRTGTPAIPPLIELLKDTRTRVRVDAARILRRITRQQSLGVDHAKWAAWWDRQPRR